MVYTGNRASKGRLDRGETDLLYGHQAFSESDRHFAQIPHDCILGFAVDRVETNISSVKARGS